MTTQQVNDQLVEKQILIERIANLDAELRHAYIGLREAIDKVQPLLDRLTIISTHGISEVVDPRGPRA